MSHFDAVPLWREFRRVKRLASGREELLSVYRDHGVVRKNDRDDNFNKPSDDLTSYQVVQPGDLVVNKMKAWQGSLSVSGLHGIVSPAYFVYEHVGVASPRYLNYLLRSSPFVSRYRSLSKGIRPGQWDLDPDAFRALPLPLPSLEVQERITARLDSETEGIDAFIAEQDQLIALLTERRASAVYYAIHGRPDRAGKGVGPLDQAVAARPLKAIARFRGGGTPSTDRDDYWSEDGGVPWISISDFDLISNGRPPRKSLTADGVAAARLRPSTGPTILFAMYASVGATAVLRTPAVWNQAIVGISPLAECTLDYLAYALQAIRPSLNVLFRSNTQDNLNLDQVRNLVIPMPSKERQQQITEVLIEENGAIDAAIEDARKSIALSKERRAALIAAAVTGQIDMAAGKRVAV